MIDSTFDEITFYYDYDLITQTPYFYRVKAFNMGGLSYFSNEDCATTSSNGIESQINDSPYSVCPNPTTNRIAVESKAISNNEKVVLYNIQGQLLLQQEKEQAKLEIDISNLIKGVYIL